ncbi:hypothetical protein I3843_08G028000 [Carya illinoinensis]|nr:uncharacterized protein LOC122319376 [Carya illinoinensis]KAG6644047.1 hypothetical protein CIPAW_08G028200 [Carya illinoinensis]KAG6698632.1 hypothetical protein I3842_08G028800 [Carya illinoinensis]KAG6698633.1 hypothetical protein I3842_08G028800 [Carya illinoinensis]KAG6698634.1 hypothetical protein I3842_08G028800 [Carya illinoinensis]KAG7966002.1 hypothetical protein I3843_08G028000 [Carya illinoinensis]
MLKQSPSRNQRSKSFKVKHAIQVCLLLAICIWLLYQVKHSHERKKASEENSRKVSEKFLGGHEIIKLGRKDLHPQVEKTDLETERKELEQVIEESKPEEIDDGRGGGDDEMVGRDFERVDEAESEEVDDLIDGEDREREGGSEELDDEGNGNQIEDGSFLEDDAQIEEERNTQEAREENYQGDDASNAVVQNTRSIGTEFESGRLRTVKGQEVEDADKIEVEQVNETNSTLEVEVNIEDSGPEVSNDRKVGSVAFGDAIHIQVGSVSEVANSESGSTREANIETKVHNDSTLMLTETPGSWNGTQRFHESTRVMDIASNATNREIAVSIGSGTVVPKGAANLDASAVSRESSASKTTKERDRTGEIKTGAGSASLRNENVDSRII